jgi:hypothetical protein
LRVEREASEGTWDRPCWETCRWSMRWERARYKSSRIIPTGPDPTMALLPFDTEILIEILVRKRNIQRLLLLLIVVGTLPGTLYGGLTHNFDVSIFLLA